METINMMKEDKLHTFVLSKIDENKIHGVVKGNDGKIHVQISTDSMALHEITHVGQSMKVGQLNFINSMLANASNSIGGAIRNEILAYRTQFAMDPFNMPLPVISINIINPKYIQNITDPYTGLPLYNYIK